MKNRLQSIITKIDDKCLTIINVIFNKLKEENEFELLSKIDKIDLKGLSAVRNFIAHDYDSVDDEILETVLRVHIPKIKLQIENILNI